jgi:hypothetical protein
MICNSVDENLYLLKISRMKFLLVVFLVFTASMYSCKPRKTKSETTQATQDSAKRSLIEKPSTTNTGTGWPSSDKDEFVDECVKNAANQLNTADAITYCRCMQQAIEQKYPDSKNLNLTEAETQTLATACVLKHNLKPNQNTGNSGNTPDPNIGGTPPTNPAYNRGDDDATPWTTYERQVFLDNCAPKLVQSMGATRAQNYCECMLQKIMIMAPNAQDADKISKSTMQQWGRDCLK